MKRKISCLWSIGLLCLATGCTNKQIEEIDPVTKIENIEENKQRQVLIQGERGESIMFKLNESALAISFYDQLPLSIEVENYHDNEKIFYPPEPLDVEDAPLDKGQAGILAYYEPWGDIAMFYGECSGADGLYALGEAVHGKEQISQLSGRIEISQVQE